MASEHPPVLFSVRSGGDERTSATVSPADSKTIACQLLHTLTATLNTPYALHQITEVLGSQLGADVCLVLWHHIPNASITYTYWQSGFSTQLRHLPHLGPSSPSTLHHRVAQGLIQQCAASQLAPAVCSWRDLLLTLIQDHPSGDGGLAGLQVYRSLALTATPDCEGVVILLNRRPAPGLTIEEALAVNLASVVAIALHQHHLYQQAQRSNEQLRYLNYLKEDFLSTLNHELRTPLTSMMLAIRMLRRPDLTPDRAAMYLDILEQQCSRETDLVNDLLMLQTLNTGGHRTPLKPVDLVQILSTLVQESQNVLAAAHLSLVVDLPTEPVPVLASVSHLTRIIQEILTNARKYSASGSGILLTLAPPRRKGDRCHGVHPQYWGWYSGR